MVQGLILVVNAGSSSLKWALFRSDDLKQLASGMVERIGLSGGINTVKIVDTSRSFREEVELEDHSKAVSRIIDVWGRLGDVSDLKSIRCVGFRVVHGGADFTTSVLIDGEVIAKIKDAARFAPLHNPPAILAIKAFQEHLPGVSLTASFDTAFHTTIPPVNHIYAIPYNLSKKHGIRRYGFHGLSHQYITERLAIELGRERVSFISLHLGNGASLCAVENSLSLDTTMGLTPLQGLVMGTRSGDIDPAIYSFLNHAEGLTIEGVEDLLNKKGGLLGISGISSDLRDIEGAIKSGNNQARLAFDIFAQRVANYVADYANKLGDSLEALVFTAGIGENSPTMRQAIVDRLNFKRLELDQERNKTPFKDGSDLCLVSQTGSEIPIYVIRTNEEIVIAREAKRLVGV